jgi:hypothetical protein
MWFLIFSMPHSESFLNPFNLCFCTCIRW